MNWPASIPPTHQQDAEKHFFSELKAMAHIADAVRAAAVLIGTARSAPDSSAVAQIGVTWQQGPNEFQSRYLHGHVDELASMSNEEIMSRWEALPT
jgi:hypothetical protein